MKILHLEDQAMDAQLVEGLLQAAWPGAVLTQVATRDTFLAALAEGDHAVILADLTLPGFSGLEALQLAKEHAPEIPFIFLSGTLGEDRAIDALDRGATDYVFKEHINRLVPVVRRAVRESASRRELVELNAQLEQRVGERTSRLEAAMKELEAFSYSVSHDLRSPLRAIDGFSRALLDECGSRLDAEGHRLVGTIRNETRRMSRLIDDLLAFSRAGRQQIDPDLVDMTELARSAFQNLLEASPDRAPPAFHLDALPPAKGDRAMLRQVFANLLDNACKFTSRHPQPAISVTGSDAEGFSVYCVKDNGVGYDPRYAHKLFGVFQRLHSQHEFEGTGVGLALVQRVVQRHDGRVWAESAPGAGAAFFFSLPHRPDASVLPRRGG